MASNPPDSAPISTTQDSSSTSQDPPAQITPTHLQTLLRDQLSATHVSITDMSGGCGSAFSAEIVSPQFATCKTSLARHRLVNKALKEELKSIHAWTARLWSVEEWEREREKEGGGG
ncbi:MAG: hypothetical protein M1831_006368 [Alyxoria varia]|nr:MAG: hypothetical protein M1831_006368 [Alyxoria varia]